MKKFKLISILCGVAALLASCYEDLSTEAVFEYPELEVNVPGAQSDTLFVDYGATLRLGAEISQEGYTIDDFEIKWELDIIPDQTNGRNVISETDSLVFYVENSPTTSPYMLSLSVRNKIDGYTRIRYWYMYVVNALGEGLLVARTTDGGQTSTLDLYKSPVVTYGYPEGEEEWIYDLYALGNGGEALEGTVHSMVARSTSDLDIIWKSFGIDALTLATSKGIISLESSTYKFWSRDDALFNNPPVKEVFIAENVGVAGATEGHLIMDNHYYTCNEMLDCRWSQVAYPNDDSAVFSVNSVSVPKTSQAHICVFDKNDHKFYYGHSVFLYQTSMSDAAEYAPSADWLADKEPVAAGDLKGISNAFVLKGADNKYYCVVLDIRNYGPYKIYDLDLPEVEQAKGFAFCDNAYVFYYWTDKKIYTTVLSGTTGTTSALSWKPSSNGEIIQSVKQYTQGWFGIHNNDEKDFEFTLDTHRLQMLVLTYDESADVSKFYFKPFNVSTGKFSAFKDNGSCSIEGKVTAYCTTIR